MASKRRKKMAAKKNNYLVQGSILAVSSVIVRFIGMLYKIPLTRIIGDEGMGNYTAAYEIYNLALLLSSYSIPLAVSKLISASEAVRQHRASYKIFATAMATALVLGGLASITVFAGANIWSKITKFENSDIALRVLAPTIFVFALMGVLRGLYQGKNTMLPTAISQIIEQIVNAVVSIVAAYYLMRQHNASDRIFAYGAAGGTWGTLVGALSALVILALVFVAYFPIFKRRAIEDMEDSVPYEVVFKMFFATLLPVILSQTVYNLSGTIDSAMFGNIMKAKEYTSQQITTLFGVYSNKYRQLTNLPVAIAAALGTAIVPTLSANYSQNDMESVRQKISSSVKLNMFISIPCAIGMAVLAKPIIILLYTKRENFELSVNLLRIGAIAIIFFALSTLTNGVLQGLDQMRLPVIHAGVSLGVHVVLLFVILQFFNMQAIGLVIGNITFALLVCVLNWVAIGRHIDYRQEVVRTFVIPAVASFFMGIMAWFAYTRLLELAGSVLFAFVVALVLAVFCYMFLVILFKGFTKEEMLELPGGATLYRACRKYYLM